MIPELVSNLDVLPTIPEAAGLPLPAEQQGTSFPGILLKDSHGPLMLLPYIIIGVMGGGETLEGISDGKVKYWMGGLIVALVVMSYVFFGLKLKLTLDCSKMMTFRDVDIMANEQSSILTKIRKISPLYSDNDNTGRERQPLRTDRQLGEVLAQTIE